MTVIITGAAGFIGMHVAQRLLARGERVVGIDNFNDYYDPALKAARAAQIEPHANFEMVRLDIADAAEIEALVSRTGARRVVHLAAQAGVRYSIDNPFAYERSNLAETRHDDEASGPVGGGRLADDPAEERAEGTEALEADLEADVGDAAVGLPQEVHRPLHPAPL